MHNPWSIFFVAAMLRTWNITIELLLRRRRLVIVCQGGTKDNCGCGRINTYCNQLVTDYSTGSNVCYLHWTSRFALALTADPSPFSAKHQYFPVWVLFVSKLSVSPSPTVFPLLIHIIFGVGFPVAAQWKTIMSPSATVLFAGLMIILGET